MMVEGSACVQNGARGLGDLARYPCNCPADELTDAWTIDIAEMEACWEVWTRLPYRQAIHCQLQGPN